MKSDLVLIIIATIIITVASDFCLLSMVCFGGFHAWMAFSMLNLCALIIIFACAVCIIDEIKQKKA